MSSSPHLEESWEGMSLVTLLHGIRSGSVLYTFFTRQTSQLDYSSPPPNCFILRLATSAQLKEKLKVTSHEKCIRVFSVQPFCFPSLKCCIFLFYFRVRFTKLAQDSNQLAENSMKTIPKGLQGPTLHPGKCQKTLEQWPRAAAVDFCSLNVSPQMKRS